MKNVIAKTVLALCVLCVFAGLILFGCDSDKSKIKPDIPDIAYDFFVDERDGQTYRAVVMPDGKTWMAQNLNFATPAGSWCYDDDESECEVYGRLYDWKTALIACPAEWRLPSSYEWMALFNSVGGIEIAGRKLKSSSGWSHGWVPRQFRRGWSHENNGTDDYGFSALPNNSKDHAQKVIWWSGTEGIPYNDMPRARFMSLRYFFSSMYTTYAYQTSRFSVRCMRDFDKVTRKNYILKQNSEIKK